MRILKVMEMLKMLLLLLNLVMRMIPRRAAVLRNWKISVSVHRLEP